MKKSGFTLVELLVVIAIIGVLSSVALASVTKAREKATIAKAQMTVKQIRNAVVAMQLDTNQWPGHQAKDQVQSGEGNEVWDLTTGPAGLLLNDPTTPYPNWLGPYMSNFGLDPWGNPYFFDTDYDIDPTGDVQEAAVIGSFGPNGVGQNVYDSDDIYTELIRQE